MIERINVMVDVPHDRSHELTAFWSAVLGWPVGGPWHDHPEFRSFDPPDGVPYVHVQVGDHGPRVHLDAEVADVEEATRALVALGAAAGPRHRDWQAMASPGGLPFCLVAQRQPSRPAAVTWPSGHRTRLMQVCIDSPSSWHDAEVAFWRAASGWRWRESDGAEFAGKLFPRADSPVQLLLQRLDADDAAATRAHIDLGTDDIAAETDRLVTLGASRVGPGRGWFVLRDPAGMAFCATGNDPG